MLFLWRYLACRCIINQANYVCANFRPWYLWFYSSHQQAVTCKMLLRYPASFVSWKPRQFRRSIFIGRLAKSARLLTPTWFQIAANHVPQTKRKKTQEDLPCGKKTMNKTVKRSRLISRFNGPAGAETIVLRSKRLCGLQYTGFWRDGDSKAYATVRDANPPIYNEDTITEIFECCRHVQKRAYRHLNNKVTECKGQTFHHYGKTVKGIGGKGGLTKKDKIKLLGHYMEQQFQKKTATMCQKREKINLRNNWAQKLAAQKLRRLMPIQFPHHHPPWQPKHKRVTTICMWTQSGKFILAL